MVTVGQRGPLPHRKGRDSREQHFTEQAQTEKHTNQITPKQDFNACESSLFTHIFIYIYIAAKYECIELSAQQRHLDLVGQCPTCPYCRNATAHINFSKKVWKCYFRS